MTDMETNAQRELVAGSSRVPGTKLEDNCSFDNKGENTLPFPRHMYLLHKP